MNKAKSIEKLVRNTLGILLLVVAINAFGGGYYGMTGAKSVPIEWLKGSPFQNYFIPGLILFFCIGGSALLAAILIFRQQHLARKAALSCGVIILLWLIVQVAVIGYVSWVQPTAAIAALVILFLTIKLPKYGY